MSERIRELVLKGAENCTPEEAREVLSAVERAGWQSAWKLQSDRLDTAKKRIAELEAEFHEHIGHDERANKCCGKGNPVKHEFQVRDHEKCPRCGADDVTVTWDSPSWFCDKCKGKSAADLDKECDQSELCECMKKLQDQGLAICDFEKKWSMLLVPAECAKWPLHHQIKYCPICGRVL